MPPSELATTATFLQVALTGPIVVQRPPGKQYAGQIIYDRVSGGVYLRVNSGPPLKTPGYILLNPGVAQSGTPVLYTVDDRYLVPPGPNGPFPTIAAAKSALLAQGYGPGPNGPATILILRGVYPENVSLDPSIRLASMAQTPDGATIQGTVTSTDPTGATTSGSISGVTIAPLAGDALVVNGVAARVLTLANVDLFPAAAGAAGLRVTNSNAATRVTGINSNIRGDLGFQGGAAAAGIVVWVGGGLNGSTIAVQNRAVSMIATAVICGSGLLEFGAGFTQITDLLAFQSRVSVTAGTDHAFCDVQIAGAGGASPLTVAAGARVALNGSFVARCQGNTVVIDGAGTVESVASLQFVDGDTIAPTIAWNPSGTLGHAQPKAQLTFTADPPGVSPYVVPARFETVIVRGTLSAAWTFQFEAANAVVDGHEIVFKNLDPTRAHRFTLPLGSTVDAGLLALPANVATRDFLRLRADRTYNDWVQC